MTDRIEHNFTPLILPGFQEHLDLSQSINIIKNDHNWLEDAVPLDIYVSKSKRLRGLVNSIYDEVERIILIHSRSRYRDVLKMVIVNLYYGHYKGKPVMYSRDHAYYARNSRYGKLFIKYDRLMPVIDALETLGYIEHKRGFWDGEKQLGRRTRMWSTLKLWRRFRKFDLKRHNFYSVARPENVIVLRDGSKHNKGMRFAYTADVRRLANDLEQYNDYLDEHDITLDLDGSVKVSTEFLTNFVYRGILKNTIEIGSVNLFTAMGPPFSLNSISRPVVQSFPTRSEYTTITTNLYTVPYHLLLTTMTQRFLPDALIHFGFRGLDESPKMLENYLMDLSLSISMDPNKERKKKRLEEEYPLKETGIESLVLHLRQEYIHRVFNRGSFKLGGRGYGAQHQRLPKHIRPFIRIDGQPTVELDYSAYHIRMLYHQKGIDYRDDPYVACEGPEMRATYRAVGLIAINGDEKQPRKVYGAIRDELKSRSIPIPQGEKPLVGLVDRFKAAHPDIAEDLYSDRGVHLMNIDGRIMNAILMRLMKRGILGLSVYDSVIVAEQHRAYLYQVMMEEYEKVMGYTPIVD